MVASNFVLPQFLSLKINNMTTFPQGQQISFEKGINVIFGGNHSGKTTIVNSIRFGIFGLSWNHIVEGVEKRYFSSRIKEIERKSLDISTVYRVMPVTIEVNRRVFSSGAAEIEAKMSRGHSNSLSTSAEIVNREKNYYDTLRERMGLIDTEQLKLIPSLIFADENRQLILWSKNLEDFVLSLLTSSKNVDRLRWVASQLSKAKKDVDKIQQDKDQITRKNLENERIIEFLKESLKKIEQMKIDKHIEEYRTTNTELENCKISRARINEKLQNEMTKRSDLQTQIYNNQQNLLDLKAKSEECKKELIKAILNPSSPEESHFSRYLFYEKKCPFCSADLSKEINLRLQNNMCIVCGQGALTTYRGDIKEIEQRLSSFDEEAAKILESNNQIRKALDKTQEKIEMLTKSLEEERISETALTEKIKEAKAIEETLHKKEVISTELEEIRERIDENKKVIEKIDVEIKTIMKEIEKLNELQDEIKAKMKTEIDLALSRIREKFSSFISIATNGELSGDLSQDFIPVLGGRTVFYPELASQFERTIMDYAFRIALLSVFAERTKTTPSLVLETPDEVTDESYIPYIAKAILSFSSNLSIIITTVNTEMMKQTLKNYKPNERKRRLTDLISKGTITQRKFYELPLIEYLSERQ